MFITILVAISLLFLWSLVSYFTSRVEHADYILIKKHRGYEVRAYKSHIEAQTTVEGDYQEALGKGFRIIATYIFGGNRKQKSIAMTSPVIEQTFLSEKIAMTTPILASNVGSSHLIAFGMPRSYTMETLPTPNDNRVKLIKVPAKKMAVLRFSWYRSSARVAKMKEKLVELLRSDKVHTLGSPMYAGYSAPFTPPWMQRNEILIEIK